MSQEKDQVYKTSQKLSESFTAVNYMEIELSQENVDIEDFPTEIERTSKEIGAADADELKTLGFTGTIQIEDPSVDVVKIRYSIEAYKDRAGIKDIDMSLQHVYVAGTYYVWNDEKGETDEFDFEIEDIGPFDGRAEIETNGLPFYPVELIISMKRSLDPKNWWYRVTIGQ